MPKEVDSVDFSVTCSCNYISLCSPFLCKKHVCIILRKEILKGLIGRKHLVLFLGGGR